MNKPHNYTPFEDKYIQEPISGCWLWLQHLNSWGYGTIRVGNKTAYAHRVSYEMKKGKIPEGMTIDHLCRVTSCVNPDHLEVVTNKENLRRGLSPSAINKRKTVCNRGHEINSENTYITAKGHRLCRKCNAIAVRNYKQRRKCK